MAIGIMKYFLRNPKAADDLHGIACYRLPSQVIYQHVADVSDALDWLVSLGWLNKIKSASSSPIFSLNASRRSEAEQFVAGRSERRRRTRLRKRPSSH
jgi:hypothetical protein